MKLQRQSRVWRTPVLVTSVAVVGYLLGASGLDQSPVPLGQARVSAQPAGTIQGQTVTIEPGPAGGETTHTGAVAANPAKQAKRTTVAAAVDQAYRARTAALPASDPRVIPKPAPRLRQEAPQPVLDLTDGQDPGPSADSSPAIFRTTEIDPPNGTTGVAGSPAVAQNGRHVFETWNPFAARSADGGQTFTLVDPETYSPGMTDFFGDQDVIYDKGNNRFIWERRGIDNVGTGGNFENRILLNVSPDAFVTNSCSFEVRPSQFSLTNAYMDFPRLALSNNWLYMSVNILNFAGGTIGAYQRHIVARFDLDNLGDCTSLSTQFWNFTEGWSPGLVENAREIMYMGDQIITNTGLNDTFRVYWMFDDSITLNFVDRTIAPFLFTQGNGTCLMSGGFNLCARADSRITGAVIVHNTPLPNNLGGAGDKVDFYWNTREGNGFIRPYIESAGFQGNTITYVQRKLLAQPNVTYHYGAVGANDRQHVAMSAIAMSDGQQPIMAYALDDDFNGSAQVSGWFVAFFNGFFSNLFDANGYGDYLRARMHSPTGTAWILSGWKRSFPSLEYRPNYMIVGRGRDLNAFTRFDQQ